MAEVIKMPRMSDTMTEGVIVSWLKKVGDQVKSGDVMAEVETDKATMELESYTDGVLLHIGVEEGQAVPVNAVIAVIGKQGEDFQSLLQGGGGEAAPQANAAPQQGNASENKETMTPPDQAAEPVQGNQQAGVTEQAAPQQAQNQGQSQQAQPQQQTQNQQQQNQTQSDSRVKASPLAKKIAQERGISIEELGSGSGDNGRIVRKDVESFTPGEKQAQGQQQQTQQSQPQQQFAAVQGQEGFEEVNVSQMRKTIARRLSESLFTAPHFYLTIEVNMARAMQARTAINEYLGSKVSFNDIIIKAAAAALKKHPKVNGSWLGDKIRYYNYVNIGVAIAVEDGLVVPVVRHADLKPISQITQEVKAYGEKAKSKKLQPTDFEGNTFTISNLGMFGIEEFTAIINSPDACIMAVGAIQEKPIVEKGELKVGNVMKVTLSCDHRIVDGATGAQFLQTFKQYLEEPVTILA
ncbi:MAG: pyruvate dehydrogenase complex dihydrolipoamide acetyltransferase [Sphingobacteriales bacterium]|nr:MAG: pyruvate dehydrogenase complex dihydrolipoamide acetyltransferase [Sphingobacteriales bacterium]